MEWKPKEQVKVNSSNTKIQYLYIYILTPDFILATYRILQIPEFVPKTEVSQFLSTCGDGELGSPSNTRVHSLASRVGQSQVTKMATVTFANVPPLLLEKRRMKEKQWSIPWLTPMVGKHGVIVVDVQAAFYGFTILNDVEPDKHAME